MAPEVRPLPLAVLGVFIISIPFLVAGSGIAEEKAPAAAAKPAAEKPAEKKEETLESKARLLQDLDQQIERRRAELAGEEERAAAMKSAMEAVKRELQEERTRLEGMRKEVEDAIARREKAINERLASIAKIYQSMKPKEAASALESMDDNMAVAILERLPGRNVAKIFDTMPKDRVRVLTRRLEEGRKKPE